MNTMAIALAGGLLVAGSATAQAQTASEPPQLEIARKAPIGAFLADGQGRSLYLFEADQDKASTCYEACAQAWPPLLTQGEPKAGEGVQPELLGTTERKDGSRQVTYNGWPLYYFVKDTQAGDIKGQDVDGFGAEWYLVTPEGEVAHAEAGSKG